MGHGVCHIEVLCVIAMIRKIFIVLSLLLSIQGICQDGYGFKKVTITQNDDCQKLLKQCKNKLCWVKYYHYDGRYTEGITLTQVACHHVFLKTVSFYDKNGNLLEAFNDPEIDIDYLKKTRISKIKKDFQESGRFVHWNYKSRTDPKEPYFLFDKDY